MARPKPWLKMWIEWIHDPKMLGLTLAETGAWWKLVTLAQQCVANGQLIKGNGSPLTLPEIANSLHISTPRDMKTLQSMIEKMEAAGSLAWNNHTLTVVHFEERQAKVASESKEAVRERVRRHRESRSVTDNPLQEVPESPFVKELRYELATLPSFMNRQVEHEVVREALMRLGEKKGYTVAPEVITKTGRIDLTWVDETGGPVAAFEIDDFLPQQKSLTKLTAAPYPTRVIILRTNPIPTQQVGDILVIGLGRERKTPLTTPTTVKEEEGEAEEKSVTLPLHSNGETVTAEAFLAEIVKYHEQNFGIITPLLAEKFKDFAENYRGPVEWIHDAFEEACSKNVRKWAYVEAILERWQTEGRGEKYARRAKGKRPGAPREYSREEAERDGWTVVGEEEGD